MVPEGGWFTVCPLGTLGAICLTPSSGKPDAPFSKKPCILFSPAVTSLKLLVQSELISFGFAPVPSTKSCKLEAATDQPLEFQSLMKSSKYCLAAFIFSGVHSVTVISTVSVSDCPTSSVTSRLNVSTSPVLVATLGAVNVGLAVK